jgi:hypothetical protein
MPPQAGSLFARNIIADGFLLYRAGMALASEIDVSSTLTRKRMRLLFILQHRWRAPAPPLLSLSRHFASTGPMRNCRTVYLQSFFPPPLPWREKASQPISLERRLATGGAECGVSGPFVNSGPYPRSPTPHDSVTNSVEPLPDLVMLCSTLSDVES